MTEVEVVESRDAVYVETSALVKLVRAEAESAALRDFLANRPRRVASALVIAELLRAVGRGGDPDGSVRTTADQVIQSVATRDVTDEVLQAAGILPPVGLRSLDAIHMATALDARDHLACVVTYDDRVADAARYHGLPVVSPGG